MHCTVYIVQCTLYSVQCTLYSVQCVVYIVKGTLCSVIEFADTRVDKEVEEEKNHWTLDSFRKPGHGFSALCYHLWSLVLRPKFCVLGPALDHESWITISWVIRNYTGFRVLDH